MSGKKDQAKLVSAKQRLAKFKAKRGAKQQQPSLDAAEQPTTTGNCAVMLNTHIPCRRHMISDAVETSTGG